MSLTIQAPHANMNAYEIGDDETRKNKVSDKGTIYAGDLQFAQTTGCLLYTSPSPRDCS